MLFCKLARLCTDFNTRWHVTVQISARACQNLHTFLHKPHKFLHKLAGDRNLCIFVLKLANLCWWQNSQHTENISDAPNKRKKQQHQKNSVAVVRGDKPPEGRWPVTSHLLETIHTNHINKNLTDWLTLLELWCGKLLLIREKSKMVRFSLVFD